jgi:glycerol-3-phosphate O-acyltransferase
MSMLVENAVFSSSHYDLKFIPVSINYEKIVEEKAMMREQRGLKKKPESLWGIIKSFRSLKYRYGNVYIRFGEPLSIKQWLGKEKILSLREEGRSQSTSVSQVAEELAHELMLRRASQVTVTGSGLIAISMLTNSLRGMAESRMMKRIDFLMDYLVHEKAPLAKNSGHMARLVSESLAILIKSGIISKYNDGTGSIFAIADKKRVHLDYYKNGIIQYFAAPSAIMLILRRFGSLSIDDIVYHFEKLGTILKGEFFFVNFNKDRVEEILNKLRTLGVIQFADDHFQVQDGENADLSSMFEQVLRNYIEGYYIVSGKLAELNGRLKTLKQEESIKGSGAIGPLSPSRRPAAGSMKIPIAEEGRRLYYLGEVKNLESTSESLFASAIGHMFSEENALEAKIQRDYLKSLL